LPKRGWNVKPSVKKSGQTIRKVRLRSGRIVDFDRNRLTNDILRRVKNRNTAEALSGEVVRILEQKHAERIPTTKDIYYVVQSVLADNRKQHGSSKPWKHYHIPHRLTRPKLPKFVIIPLLILCILAVEYLAARDTIYPTFYILVAIVAGFIIYLMFRWASRLGSGSDLSLFGLRILSGLLSAAGLILLMLWFMFVIWFPMISLAPNLLTDPKMVAATVFVVVFGFGLLLLGAFLYFRFMRRSGVIVYPR
jgi:hypothetical protein